MYECFHCGLRTVIWDNDFSYVDFGMDMHGDGIVHVCHCTNCGAEILYFIDCEEDTDGCDDGTETD